MQKITVTPTDEPVAFVTAHPKYWEEGNEVSPGLTVEGLRRPNASNRWRSGPWPPWAPQLLATGRPVHSADIGD